MTITAISTVQISAALAAKTLSPQSSTGESAAPAAPAQVPDAVSGSPLAGALAEAKESAAAEQDGLSPLLADAKQAAASEKLPPPVQSAVARLNALQLPSDTLPDASTIRTALVQSGLFTENMLAAGVGPVADLKTALLSLLAAAKEWKARTGSSTSDAAKPSKPSIPPPLARGQGQAQPAATPVLTPDADAAAMASRLADGSKAALARLSLLQIASLPGGPRAPGAPQLCWVCDVPILTPQGSAVAQFIVERDGGGSGTDAPAPVWRMRFAIDVEPLGPVRAAVALSGADAWVTVAADRPESLAKLRANAGELNDALTAAELDADIAFQAGPVSENGGRTAQFVDRSS